jgi:hypothetical protein
VLKEIPLSAGITLNPVGKARDRTIASLLDFSSVAARPTLAISVQGISHTPSSNEICGASAIRTCKIVVALGLVMEVLERKYSPTPPLTRASQTDEQSGAFAEFEIPADFAGVINGVTLSEKFRRSPGTLLTPARDLTAEEIHLDLVTPFARIGAVLERAAAHSMEASPQTATEESMAENEHCSRIATAAEWLFDSSLSGPSAMGYVQLAIAFEALFGGNKNEPVGRTLGNRLAYSLARTSHLREKILREFAAFYERRSEIVHSGASRLTASDAKRYHWGRFTIERAMANELGMVRSNPRESWP